MIINVNEDKIFKKRDLKAIFPYEFGNRWLINQFITYVLNHFFEKSHEKSVSSYIGEYQKNVDGETCYLNEPTQERQLNQLIPFVKYGENIVNYENFIANLHNEGCLVENTNKLLSGKYWSWCPPINIDMFINYNHYYWIGTNGLEKTDKIIYDVVDVTKDVVGKSKYIFYKKDKNNKIIQDSKIEFNNGDVIVFLNDKSKSYSKVPYVITGVGERIKLLPISTPLYYLDSKTNIVTDILGKTSYEYKDETGYGKTFNFLNGMRIIFLNDENPEYNNKIYIVDGVGKTISLIEDEYNDEGKVLTIDSSYVQEENEYTVFGGKKELLTPSYHTIERGSIDGNRWSKTNRWVHRNVLDTLNITSISVTTESEYKKYDKNSEYKLGEFINNNGYMYMCSVKTSTRGDFDKKEWKFITKISLDHATYPIICFQKNMELYNHGTKLIGTVDYVTDIKSSDVNGKTEYDFKTILNIKDGNILGKKILFLGNNTTDIQLFEIQKFGVNDNMILSQILSEEGIVSRGDCVYVNNKSNMYENKNLYFNGLEWKLSQEKENSNDCPLFNLYDYEKEMLGNEVIYPHTTFKGSKVFDYEEYYVDSDTTLVKEIDRYVKNDEIAEYNFKFNNHLQTDVFKYTPYNDYEKEIIGYKYLRCIDTDSYINDWHINDDNDRVYLKTRVIINNKNVINKSVTLKLLYSIAQNTVRTPLFVYKNGNILDLSEYTVDKQDITINDVKENDIIEIRFLTDDDIKNLDESYVFEQPLSISVNQKNEDILKISYNNCFDQMVDIITNNGLGKNERAFGKNNYSSGKQNLSLGTKIIQHSESLLKTMILTDKASTSIRASIEYALTFYEMFKLKFEYIVNNMYKSGKINDLDYDKNNTEQLDDVIKEIIGKINIGKDGVVPFYNNGVLHLIDNAYIPSTPAYLGMTGCFEPRIEVFEDHFKEDKPEIMINHDGSFRNVTGTIKDAVFMRMETLIYNSIHQNFKDRKNGVDRLKFVPGKFRKTQYSRTNILDVYSQHFNMWAHLNEVRYDEHYKFDYNLETNDNAWKTWNYTECYDIDGEKLFGSYRSVYTHYYDTYRPDTHPWEMLGFDDKPSWWETHYGSYPYTSLNKNMWSDIENGIIRDGHNKGQYEYLKRSGLIEKYMPVDEMGNLKSPMSIGIIDKVPFLQNAKKPWKIGDMGEMELIYRYTSEYKFIQEMMTYLLRPCEWVETNWNTLERQVIFGNTNYEQVIDVATKRREKIEDTIIHNEIIDGKHIRKLGLQQWISDYIISDNLNVTNIANDIRNTNVNIGYRCAGYYKNDDLIVNTDSYGEIPSENIHIKLFKSNVDKTVSYSGIKIIKTQTGFMIDGFDKSYPYFKIRVPFYNGQKASIEESGVTVFYYNNYTDDVVLVPYKTEYKTIQDVYTFINAYSKYLEDNENWYFTTLLPSGETSTFRVSAKSFLTWAGSQVGSETNGNILLLNPGAYGIGNYTEGMVDDMSIKIGGRCTIVDVDGQPIPTKNISLMRNPYNTYINPKEQPLAFVKLKCVKYEHIMLFDNKTIFNDILYDPKFSTIISRLKLQGVKVTNWYGSLYAPGYIVTDNGVIENYEKKASDLQYIFDVDDVRCSGKLGDYSRATVGFHKSNTFKKLFQNNKSMFDFYKGSIAEKGTRGVINKMNNSTHISSTGKDIEIYENWLFKVGEFGYTSDNSVLECLIDTERMDRNSQIMTFETLVSNYYDETLTYNRDDVVVYKSYQYKCLNDNISGKFDTSCWKKQKFVGNYIIFWNDEEWLKKPNSQNFDLMQLSENRIKNTTAGFVCLDECDYILANEDNLELQTYLMNEGEKVWVIKKNDGDWDVFKKTGLNKLVSMRYKTLDDAMKQNEKVNVYHFKDNNIDYYTDKTRDTITGETIIYRDVDLTSDGKPYSEISTPMQNPDVDYCLYKNGNKYKVKMFDTIFETIEDQDSVDNGTPMWTLGSNKETDSITYSNLLLEMGLSGKTKYNINYPFKIHVKPIKELLGIKEKESSLSNTKITINGVTYDKEYVSIIVNHGDKIKWEVTSDNCYTMTGEHIWKDYDNDLDDSNTPFTHKEKTNIDVYMNYKTGSKLVNHLKSNETQMTFVCPGEYEIELVGAGGGASGGSWYKGSLHDYRRYGSGGSSGGYGKFSFKVTEETLKKERRYVIYTGKGGIGGLKGKKKGETGSGGESSYFGYYDENNTLIKLCEVYGGTSNYGARNYDELLRAEGGRPLCEGGYVNNDILNTTVSNEYSIVCVEEIKGASVEHNNGSGGQIFNDGQKNLYGRGGNGLRMEDGQNGYDGYSLLKFVKPIYTSKIVYEEQESVGKQIAYTDSKDYVSYYQRFINSDDVFYSRDVLYKDDNILKRINDDLQIINPMSKFYKNRCRTVTALHNDNIVLNQYISTDGKEYNVGDTVTNGFTYINENGQESVYYKYYICIKQHINDGVFKNYRNIDDKTPVTDETEIYWVEHVPTYYYKITNNGKETYIDTYPTDDSGLYYDAECKYRVYDDNGVGLTCKNLKLPKKYNDDNSMNEEYEEQIVEYLGHSYYLIDLLGQYIDLEPTYISEPTWGRINHNGFYSINSGNREYFVKFDEQYMNQKCLEYKEKINPQTPYENLSDEHKKIVDDLYVYSDEKCINNVQRCVLSGENNIVKENMLYIDLINVVSDNLDKCYEYMDNDLLLYSTKKEYEIKNDTEIIFDAEMFFDADMLNSAGHYSDYMPKWTKTTPKCFVYTSKLEDIIKVQNNENGVEYISLNKTYYIKKDKIMYNLFAPSIMMNGGIETSDLYECSNNELRIKNENGFTYDENIFKKVTTNVECGMSNVKESTIYTEENTTDTVDIKSNIKFYDNQQCVGNAMYIKDLIQDVDEYETLDIMFVKKTQDVEYNIISNSNSIEDIGDNILRECGNDGYVDTVELEERYRKYRENREEYPLFMPHKCKVIHSFRYVNSENGGLKKEYKKLYLYGDTYFEKKNIYDKETKIVHSVGIKYATISTLQKYENNDNTNSSSEYQIVNVINYLNDGDIVYIDNDSYNNRNKDSIKRLSDTNDVGSEYGVFSNVNDRGWIKAEFTGREYRFNTLDIERAMIDTSSIESVYIIDDKSDKTLAKVQLFDPLQNIIPNKVLDEVNFISSTDPVVNYNDSGKWCDNKVGYLWWDTSKVRYLDYHLGDLKYKQENWGKQMVGSEIAIYEWYRDTIQPTDGRQYVTKTIYNEQTDTFETYYYYWLKNPSVIPSLNFRNNSAYNIAKIIANPSNMGIAWVAPIDLQNLNTSKLSLLLCEYNNILNDNECTLQINIKKRNTQQHAEWLKIAENTSNIIPDYLWERLKDSLLGYKEIDGVKYQVPNPNLSERNKIGLSVRPRQSMFKNIYNARVNMIDVINDVFLNRDIENISKDITSEIVDFVDRYEDRKIEYYHEVSTKLEMMRLQDTGLIGKTILVRYDETHDNIWVLYQVESLDNGEDGYKVIDYQRYDIKKYLTYKDWYMNKEIEILVPTFVTNDINKVNNLLKQTEIGRIVKYTNGDEWQLFRMSRNPKTNIIEKQVVGISNTLLQIKTSLYDYVNDNIDNNTPYINDNGTEITKYEYIENESNTIIEYLIDYFGNI